MTQSKHKREFKRPLKTSTSLKATLGLAVTPAQAAFVREQATTAKKSVSQYLHDTLSTILSWPPA